METLLAASVSALWLGIMTSVSPCPLATNIAAVSYVGRQVGSPRKAMWAGAGYIVGRLVAYVAVAIIVTAGILSIPGISNFLQRYAGYVLGPVLILTGIVLLGVLPLRMPQFASSNKVQGLASRGSVWGASLLGAIFALSFCPVSAALFFGSLVPLAVRHQSYLLLPSLFGVGTGLPVLVFGLVIATSVQGAARLFERVTAVEKWVRIVAAVIFILVGIYYILANVLFWI